VNIGRQHEPWEHDPAHQALDQWIYAWRRERPDEDLPKIAFTIHIGREAREVAEGMGKVELLRLFAAAGFDGQCVCGIDFTAKPATTLTAAEAS
jgi:hypothetical protein